VPEPRWVRVRDRQTRHEFDVHEDSILLRRGAVELVKPKQYPPARLRRPTKHHLNLAAPARQDVAASAGDDTPEKE